MLIEQIKLMAFVFLCHVASAAGTKLYLNGSSKMTKRCRDNNSLLFTLIHLVAIVHISSGGSVNVDRRLSNRIVTTKYGALRGQVVTLPNRSLQPVESFLGELRVSLVNSILCSICLLMCR